MNARRNVPSGPSVNGLVEGCPSSAGFDDDVLGGGFPDERFRVFVPVGSPGGFAVLRSATLLKVPRRSRLSVSSLNQRSMRLSQELEVGVK